MPFWWRDDFAERGGGLTGGDAKDVLEDPWLIKSNVHTREKKIDRCYIKGIIGMLLIYFLFPFLLFSPFASCQSQYMRHGY